MTFSISPSDLGARLRNARETAQITQADAAEHIRVARTTLAAMEQGRRRIRMEELRQLARLYRTSANDLLRAEAVHIDLVSRFRKRVPRDGHAHEAARLLTVLVQAETELENALGIEHAHNTPPERPLLPSADVRVQAMEDATELRQRLGLGMAPVRDPETVLKMEFGMRIYPRRIAPRIAGLFAYHERVGGCLLLNASQPRDRRALTCARELGRFVSNRRQPDVLYRDEPGTSRGERYADAFARAFLMPLRAMDRQFRRTVTGMSKFTRQHLALLAQEFGVPQEAMVRRLEELSLAPAGAWDWFAASSDAAGAQPRKIPEDRPAENSTGTAADRPVPLRLGLMALEAREKELLSEGQLADLLNLKRIELRDMLLDMEAERGDPRDALELAA